MFRRLADYFAHKRSKSCRRFVDSEAQTSPPPACVTCDVLTVDCQTTPGGDCENDDLANVVRESLQTSLGDDPPPSEDACSQLAPSVCDEPDEVEPLDAVTENDIVLVPDVTYDVSRSSTVEDGDVMTADEAGGDDDEPQSQDRKDGSVAASDGLPEAPPPHRCPQCDFTAKFRDDFDQHLRRQHGLSSYVCIDCWRAFTDAYKLRQHQRTYCTKTPVRKKQNALLPGQDQQLVPPR